MTHEKDDTAPPPQDSRTASTWLFAARAVGALASFLTNLYLARAFGPTEYGKYALTVAILTFCSFFFDFGYFASAARLLTTATGEESQRRLIGAVYRIWTPLSVAFILLVLALSTVADRVLTDPVGDLLARTALLAPMTLTPWVIEQILKATRRIGLLSVWTAGAKTAFAGGVAGLAWSDRLDVGTAIQAYLASELLGFAWVTWRVRPRWRGVSGLVREISAEHRRFGRPLYVGRVASVISYHSDKLLLAFFWDAAAVGCYSLAMALASAITMFSQSVAVSGFRDFAGRGPISERLLRWNRAGIVMTSAAVLALAPLIVRDYLGAGYEGISLLMIPAVLACAGQGAYQPYNSWLLANGFGEETKRPMLMVAAVNLIANVALIPPQGSLGAALASAAGLWTFWWLSLRLYRQLRASSGGSPAGQHAGEEE
jgi:O-antigen/teichoic acid export membrane protein